MEDVRKLEAVRRYHERSKHRPARFAPGPGRLDWANQPDPFRAYAGSPTVELPLAGDDLTATWSDLHSPGAVAPHPLDLQTLGAFFELTLGLTAWKEASGTRWALRANPSSGNLHPTEGYAFVPEAAGVAAALYHYRSDDHVLERRWTPAPGAGLRLDDLLPEGGFVLGLSSIHWREAWKYGERAFRYCQHDVGHALAAARYAAAVLGWTARLLAAPGDDDVAAALGLDRADDFGTLAPGDGEHPDALVLVAPAAGADEGLSLDGWSALLADGVWTGRPGALSPEHVDWPEIETVADASRKPRTNASGGEPVARPVAPRGSSEGEAGATMLIRQRRSAVAMDGHSSIPAGAFFTMLGRLLPRPGAPPWDVLPWAPRLHPVLFVHRVEGLAPGLYVLERDASVHDALRESLRSDLRWERPAGTPDGLRLFLLDEGDARSFAQLASCQQAIAADSAFSLGMLSVFEESLREGPWWYRRLFWEAGVLGQVLYLEAEAAGLRGTGIGCYLDDVVHELLGLDGTRFQDLYHFTVGGPVEDTRLATRPAYPEAVHSRG